MAERLGEVLAQTADSAAVVWAINELGSGLDVGREMLHVDFYARGISLPHHQRDDFQSEWQAVAAELGFPALRHNDEDDRRSRRRGAIVRIITTH